jgi:hypothetical protein
MAASAVAWLEVLLEGLRNGSRTWADWDEDLEDMPDRTQIAIRRCEAELARAREHLRALTRTQGSGENHNGTDVELPRAAS